MTRFIPGLELNRMYYREAVAPILAADFTRLKYSAALIGYGSDVLGYDSERSTDHEWGPRLLLFLDDVDHDALASQVTEVLARNLPPTFHGYSTGFSKADENGVRWLVPAEAGRIDHHIYTHTVSGFVRLMLNIEPRQTLDSADWLLMSQQKLLEITSGEVFHDGLGELFPLREKLAWYPRDVWLFMMAAGWYRIAQEEHFVGRCGEEGDDLGSHLVAGRLVRDLMRLCLLMERRYSPYSKWLGTAFSRLACATGLSLILRAAMSASSWQDREQHLCSAYEAVARMHKRARYHRSAGSLDDAVSRAPLPRARSAAICEGGQRRDCRRRIESDLRGSKRCRRGRSVRRQHQLAGARRLMHPPACPVQAGILILPSGEGVTAGLGISLLVKESFPISCYSPLKFAARFSTNDFAPSR